MFKINFSYIIVGALILSIFAFMQIQANRIETLTTKVKEVSTLYEQQGERLDKLVEDYKGLKALDGKKGANRATRDMSDQKMYADSKRSNVVVAKPKLVETQINNSFNKLAQDMQEASK